VAFPPDQAFEKAGSAVEVAVHKDAPAADFTRSQACALIAIVVCTCRQSKFTVFMGCW
jgi:hypothetical protein